MHRVRRDRRIRGERPAFTEQEITEVYVDELCVGDTFVEYGRRWFVEFPTTGGGRMPGDMTVLARADGDHGGTVHTLNLPADRALKR